MKTKKNPLHPESRRPVHFFILAICLLICGIIIGSVGTLGLAHHVIYANQHNPEKVVARITGRIDHKLHLTNEQKEQARGIVHERLNKVNEIRQQAWKDVASEIDRTEADMAQILDDSQKVIWHKHIHNLRRHLPCAENNQCH